ncbi:hypothetical protein BX616_001182 [Lobosporangium transversale]|nr:hypothetical protein BX616_001182 [Lobosporangium transversale]
MIEQDLWELENPISPFSLLAKAYAEGWPVLYVTDAGELVQANVGKTGTEICERFFALSKDRLTIADFKEILKMFSRNPTAVDTAICTASRILSSLVCQVDKKTLAIIDEHGKLFKDGKPVPNLFRPLIDIHLWDPASNGARVIFTVTAFAGYETIILTRDVDSILEFVGPLFNTIFDKLLASSPLLSEEGVREEAKRATNNVSRGLNMLVGFLNESGPKDVHLTTVQKIKKFENERRASFAEATQKYYQKLDDTSKQIHLEAISRIF